MCIDWFTYDVLVLCVLSGAFVVLVEIGTADGTISTLHNVPIRYSNP